MELEPCADELGAVTQPFISPSFVRRELKNGCGGDGEVAQWVARGPGLGSLVPM